MYAVLYLHLETLSLLFSPEPVYDLFSYRWTSGTIGLSYLGVGLGSLLGTIICAKYLNRNYVYMTMWMARRTGMDTPQPEARLPFMQIGMIVGPLGLVVFAWTAQRQTHWAVPLVGAATYAVGMLMVYICIQTYLVDAFEQFAASALAGTVLLRSILGCIFSIIGFKLYKSLGYAWYVKIQYCVPRVVLSILIIANRGTMLLAFLLIALAPTPLVLYLFGPRLRRVKTLRVDS